MWAIIIHVRNVKEVHRVLIFPQCWATVSSIGISPLFNPSPSPLHRPLVLLGMSPFLELLWLLAHIVVGYTDLAGDDCL